MKWAAVLCCYPGFGPAEAVLVEYGVMWTQPSEYLQSEMDKIKKLMNSAGKII
jgi:hypothetical protein